MKLFRKKYMWISTSMLLAIGYMVSCTKDNQVLNIPQVNSSTDLLAYKTSTAPVIDGTIDAVWANATKLNVTVTVPDPGNGLFTGYIGEQYPISIRAMYDANNIYFLAEVQDASKSTLVAPWYFDPASNVTGKTGWQKEPSSKSLDVNGNVTRDGFGEDKIAMLWNIDNSTPKFITQTCYGSCHIFSPYMDYSKNPAVYTSNSGNGNHYTNGQNEKIDMWWGRLGYISKDPSLNNMDDNYQDFAGGSAVTNLTGGNANGRHQDGQIIDTLKTTVTWPYAPHYTSYSSTLVTTPPAGQIPAMGEVSNSQNLKLDGTGASVAVPIWVIPNASTNFILLSDTLSGNAKKVKAVSSAGVLTFTDNTTLTPGADYQRSGDPVYGPTANYAIPSYIAVPLSGGRADITAAAIYTGSGWVIEYKRALKTADVLKQDIDFTYLKDPISGKLQDQPFGIAFWNKSNNQHGIQPNLMLKFQ